MPDASTVSPPLSIDQQLGFAITAPACLYPCLVLKTALTGILLPSLTCIQAIAKTRQIDQHKKYVNNNVIMVRLQVKLIKCKPEKV